MYITKCQICHSKPSHGVHFDAESCRACAAFFRRAIFKKYINLNCRNGDGKCEKSRLESCKKCRLEKCYAAGMSENKFQNDRDLMSSTERQIPPSVQYFVGRPTLIFFGSDIHKKSDRSYIDFTKLIEKASNIMATESKLYVGMNTLNKLTYALTTSKKSPKMCQKIGKNELLKFWEIGFLKVAEWFTYCDKFQELPLSMRVEFLKIVWFTWIRLQNDAMTANRNLVADRDEKFSYFADGYIVDANTVDLDVSWFTKFRKEHFIEPIKCNANILIGSLMNLRPTAQEITYMLSIFSFRHAAKLLKSDFEALSENMIEILGDEIHNYYINEVKLIHYAHRISKMLNIVNFLERSLHEKMEKIELARMFDIITVDFSHPEIFFGRK